MFRVCRVGVFFGGITSDMTETVIEKHDLFEGVQTLCSLGDWMELFMKQGFRPAVTDIKVLKRIWKIENDANLGDDQWYPDMHAMRCCFYSKPDAPPPPRRPKRGGKSSIIKLEHALAAKPRNRLTQVHRPRSPSARECRTPSESHRSHHAAEQS
jgi:hypothetical protein